MKTVMSRVGTFQSLALAVTLAGLLSGCVMPSNVGSGGAALVPSAKFGAEEGYLVGSFSHIARPYGLQTREVVEGRAAPYRSYSFYYRSVGTPEGAGIRDSLSLRFGTFGEGPKADFNLPDGRGYQFVIPLPAGDYQFYGYFISHTDAMGSTMWSNREPFDIPFKIRAGEVTYVGEICAVQRLGKNVFGITLPSGANWVILAAGERDRPLLEAAHPFLVGLPWNEPSLSAEALEEPADPADKAPTPDA